MKVVEPDPTALIAFLEQAPDEPVIMLNLLRYRERAAYPAGADTTPCSGREAYERYGAVALGKLAEVGATILFAGSVSESLIAPDGERWDDAVLVRYPTRSAMLRMLAMPDYLASAVHRTAALDDSRLIATVAQGGSLTA